MNTIATRFFSKIIQRPFRTYALGVPVGFGLTAATNFAKGIFDDQNAPVSWYTDGQEFFVCTVAKSVFYGTIWPAIPIAALCRPRSYFVLGSTCEVTREGGEFSIRYGRG